MIKNAFSDALCHTWKSCYLWVKTNKHNGSVLKEWATSIAILRKMRCTRDKHVVPKCTEHKGDDNDSGGVRDVPNKRSKCPRNY